MPELQHLVVEDDKERWVIYEDDQLFRMLEKIAPDEEGVRQVDSKTLAQVKGWWYDKAAEKVEEVIASLDIPWDELQVTPQEALEAEAPGLSEKLAQVSFHMVKVSRRRSETDYRLYLAKTALEHAVQKKISRNESKGTVASRVAKTISADKRLRNAKIEVMEGEALKRALDGIGEALDAIWKTVSRILSVRMREPIE